MRMGVASWISVARAVALAVCLAAGVPRAAGAEEDVPTIVVTPGGRTAFNVALQRFADRGRGGDASRTGALDAGLRRGIAYSYDTLLLPDAAFLGPRDARPELAATRDDCAEWRTSGADALVEGVIAPDDASGRMVIEVAVWEVARCVRLFHETYRRPGAVLERTALRIADDVVGAVTGVRGAASTEIAFVSTRSGHREIVVMDADGSNVRAATRGNSVKAFPDWLPGADGILYTSYVTAEQPDLFVASRAADVRAGRILGGVLPGAPKYRGVFSPSGQTLALVTSVDGAAEIFRVERDGRRMQRLTHGPSIEVSPAWSPDGSRIAFVSDRSGAPQIFVMNSDGTDTRRLTYQGGYNTSPSWSPDGRWIAYQSLVGSQFDIWLIDPEGKVNFPIVEHPSSDETPHWSPDGRRIAFSSKRRGRADIYTVDRSGERLERLTQAMGDNTHPSWSPYPR